MQLVRPTLRQRIYKFLDEKDVRWTSIDPLFFTKEGNWKCSPLIIWIGVEPASLSFALTNTVAEGIIFLLAEAGFTGIEIGFRESVVRRTAGPKMLDWESLWDTRNEFRKPFTSALGLAIAPLRNPYHEDTGVLYLREGQDSKRAFLTCAYVAQPPARGLARKTTSHEGIIALGDRGHTNALKIMMGAIGHLNRGIHAS